MSATERQAVAIDTGDATIDGDLTPSETGAFVVFAHGSGSSRSSPRNRHVARRLNDGGLGTLLIDLLTPAEEQIDLRTGELRFDVGMLARRLSGATEWLLGRDDPKDLRIGYFGASTGAAAALIAAAERPGVRAVVSRGGRPDLAGPALDRVRAPALLIVGGADRQVLAINRDALDRMSADTQLEIVPGATHLFEEPGALDQVADLARDWFGRHLGAS